MIQSLDKIALMTAAVALLAAAPALAYDLSVSNGPAVGGNSVLITNCSPDIGNGSDITNVTFGNVRVIAISGQGTNWVRVITPAHAFGAVSIVIQSLSAGDTILISIYTYNPAGQIGGMTEDWTQWQEVAGLPAARRQLAVGVLNGALYAIGGWNDYQVYSNVYRYDGTNWTEVVGLPTVRQGLAAGVLNGALYAFGGNNYSSQTNAFRYDGTNWTEVAGLPAVREIQAAGVLKDALYAVGGAKSDYGAQTNVYRYDGTNWMEVAGLPNARMYFAAGVLNGALYTVGGNDDLDKSNVLRYDGTNWTEVADLPTPLHSLAAGVLNGALYAVGGYNYGIRTNVFRYDGTNWTEVAGLPAARELHAAAVLNGVLYVIGGDSNQPTPSLTNVYRYPAQAVIPALTPFSGSWTGGYPVVISGTNLCNGNFADVTNVTLCGVVADVTGVSGSTQILVTAGAGMPGLGNVRVYSASCGETVKSNTFTYVAPVMTVRGTNGTVIASGETAATAKGTDFGSLLWGGGLTNTFTITNSGNTKLTISSVTTNGTGANAFPISDLQFSVDAGAVSNFTVRFTPPYAGSFTAAVQIANDSTTTPFIVYLAGTGLEQDQAITNFTPTNGAAFATTNVVQLFAQASSGLAVSFTNLAGDSVIWENATTITFSAAGTVNIVTGQAGNTNWNAAPNVTNTFAVNKAPQAALTFTPASSQVYNTTNVLSVSSGPGTGAVSYAVVSGPGQIVGETNLLLVTSGTGMVAVCATKAADAMYNATAVTATVACAKSDQTTDFSAIADQIATNRLVLNAVALSGLAVSFTNLAGDPVIWENATTITFSAAGTVSIVAGQAGDTNWNAAPNMTNTFNVGKVDQAITFPAIPDQVATSTVGLIATALSGLPVSFVVVAGGPGQINNSTNLTFTGAGSVSIVALQVGNAIWNPAPNVTGNTFNVSKATATVTLNNLSQIYNGTARIVTATTVPADLAVFITYDGSTAVPVNAGSYAVIGTVNEASYAGATNDMLAVAKANQTITFPAIPDQEVARVVTLSATANSSLMVSYSATGPAILNGNTLTFTDAGTVSIIASQDGNTNWNTAPTVTNTFAVHHPENDYDGDGKSDLAVYRNGYWSIYSMSGSVLLDNAGVWGGPGWTPMIGDYDGDGKSDLAVYHNGYWSIYSLANGIILDNAGVWGGPGWTPMIGDYDGDGKSDLAVYRNGYWSIYSLTNGIILNNVGVWGGPNWTTVSGDYDGDGKSDLAVYRNGYWSIYSLANGIILNNVGVWGGPNWTTVSGDYDGDGKSDLAVYRNGYWSIYSLANGIILNNAGVWGGSDWNPVH